MVAPDNAIPVGAVVVNVPPHTVAEALATVKPVGSVSVNPTPVRAAVLAAGLVIVNVSEVVAFNAMVLGLNTLTIVGGASTTKVAVLLVAPVPPLVELTAPVVLGTLPAWVPVTFTTTVQVLPGVAMLPPDKLMLAEFASAVTVPP